MNWSFIYIIYFVINKEFIFPIIYFSLIPKQLVINYYTWEFYFVNLFDFPTIYW